MITSSFLIRQMSRFSRYTWRWFGIWIPAPQRSAVGDLVSYTPILSSVATMVRKLVDERGDHLLALEWGPGKNTEILAEVSDEVILY